MSTTTHSLTYIHPACGKPAFHRASIPGPHDRILAKDFENLNGTEIEITQRFACQSCHMGFGPNDIFDMMHGKNWIEREKSNDC